MPLTGDEGSNYDFLVSESMLNHRQAWSFEEVMEKKITKFIVNILSFCFKVS